MKQYQPVLSATRLSSAEGASAVTSAPATGWPFSASTCPQPPPVVPAFAVAIEQMAARSALAQEILINRIPFRRRDP